ncbi:MAG: Ig-like domain-containing protein, partial [Gemmatimonadota bacterium]|nr:Ig-like domain-containing protein [Gemmatimonadota bacterium]
AIGNGTATITAQSGGVSASVTVVVTIASEPPPSDSPVASISVLPAAPTITLIGAREQLTATAFDESGEEVLGVTFQWTSSDNEVATVNDLGMVTAVGAGSTTIFASAGGVVGSSELTVIGVAVSGDTLLVSIDVMPGSQVSSIKLSSKGNTPVAILTTNVQDGDPTTFDATQVDVETVVFGGEGVLRFTETDVDGDGDVDLLVRFETDDLDLELGSILAELVGRTLDGTPIKGVDAVVVQP